MKKLFTIIFTSLFTSLFLVINPNAQTATPGSGSLSINPSTFSLNAVAAKTSLSVVYTGNDITVAEVHLVLGDGTLGPGLKISKFTVGTGLVVVYESTTTNEMHVGNLSGNITSGQTLFTFEVEATACSQNGQVGFNSTKTNIPGITISSFNPSTYTISCTGGSIAPTPTPMDVVITTPIPTSITPVPITTSYNPTTLPKTDKYTDQLFIFLSSASLFGFGIIIWILLAKARVNNTKDEIKIVVID
ncbi:hypothetical protein KBD45_05575 [Candidatus Dojkabacteria bacterium]|nr:hypothetical protein [Candidatus Dojkabacteria bacterium]